MKSIVTVFNYYSQQIADWPPSVTWAVLIVLVMFGLALIALEACLDLVFRDTRRHFGKRGIMKTVLAIFLLGIAAAIGFFLPAPMPPDYFPSVRFVDASLSVLLGVLAWSSYRIVEPVHHGNRWLILRATAIPTAWLFLIWLLYILFRYLMADFQKPFEFFTPTL